MWLQIRTQASGQSRREHTPGAEAVEGYDDPIRAWSARTWTTTTDWAHTHNTEFAQAVSSLSLTHTHTHTHTHSLSLTHTHTLSLSHTHTHTHTLSLSHTHTHTHTFSLSHTHTLSLSLCPGDSRTASWLRPGQRRSGGCKTHTRGQKHTHWWSQKREERGALPDVQIERLEGLAAGRLLDVSGASASEENTSAGLRLNVLQVRAGRPLHTLPHVTGRLRLLQAYKDLSVHKTLQPTRRHSHSLRLQTRQHSLRPSAGASG